MGVALGLALLMLALLACLWAMRLRQSAGLPWAPVVYQDTGGHAPEKPLIARRLGLVGKPDYLLELRGRVIPVEVKPGRRAGRPYQSDLMQLAAYCLLVEETSGVAPPYGLLRYAERTFRLDYTERIRDELLATLDEMRADLQDEDCDRSHDEPRRCAACGFYDQCEQALAPE
ncbi:MAG TPA: CRISPR-associated protein Cas4 [Roseiflexaceae bacterium]